MRKIDLKQRMREIRFTTEYALTPEQRNKLIQEKLDRARLQFEKLAHELRINLTHNSK